MRVRKPTIHQRQDPEGPDMRIPRMTIRRKMVIVALFAITVSIAKQVSHQRTEVARVGGKWDECRQRRFVALKQGILPLAEKWGRLADHYSIRLYELSTHGDHPWRRLLPERPIPPDLRQIEEDPLLVPMTQLKSQYGSYLFAPP